MTEQLRRNVARSSQQGFVLVAVLWLLAALAALATIFSVYLSNSARALALNDTALQTQALVSAGVELAAYRLRLAGEDSASGPGFVPRPAERCGDFGLLRLRGGAGRSQ